MEDAKPDMSHSPLLLSIHAGELVDDVVIHARMGSSLSSDPALVDVIPIVVASLVTAGSLFGRLNLATKTSSCCSNSHMLALFHIFLLGTRLPWSVFVPLKSCQHHPQGLQCEGSDHSSNFL